MKDKKVIFMGTPEFSVPVLEMLIENTNVIAVVTQPDKEVGKKGIVFSPIKEVAIKNNIKVFQPVKVRKEFDDIIALNPDIIVTCAYGQIIPTEILECPKYGCINVHASLLPYLRGGAPIHHAIIDGYSKTGITIMYMDDKMDEGDIISQSETLISDDDTTEKLHNRLSIMGRDLLFETLPSIFAGTNGRIKQDHSIATYGYNIKREDERVDFNKTRREIFNQVRGLNSWPGAYSLLDEHVLKIWETIIGDESNSNVPNGTILGFTKNGIEVKCADGKIILKLIQPEGKKKMDAISYLNGLKNKEELIGKVLV